MHPKLRNALVLENVKIVYKVVREMANGPDLDDLIQAGMIGLIRAVDRFDPRRGAFYSFAKIHIRDEVQRACNAGKGFSPRIRQTSKDKQLDLALEVLYGVGPLHCDSGERAADARAMLRKALAGIPSETIQALMLSADGETLEGVALALGSATPSDAAAIIAGALQRARTALGGIA